MWGSPQHEEHGDKALGGLRITARTDRSMVTEKCQTLKLTIHKDSNLKSFFKMRNAIYNNLCL